jgi:RHS repeat-associated protein
MIDKDGNLLTLTRDYSGDNFSYQYYSGTSKLKSIDGGGTMHYSYDNNGNVTDDLTRNVSGIKYDSRNLPVEMTITPATDINYQYAVKYRYDESGNRIRKMLYRRAIKSSEGEWKLIEDKIYIHPVTGEEYAVYNSGNIDYYNIYAGRELIGKKKINSSGSDIYYYFKDHLGNIRAVMDGTSGTITQAQDYDAWGDICRTYTSAIDTTVNKFTGKERDHETGYDYFGARYYDSRIGRWLQTEPLLEKYFQYSPYNYGLNNTFTYIDPTGCEIDPSNMVVYDKSNKTNYLNTLINDLSYITGLTLSYSYNRIIYEKDKNGNAVFDNDKGSEYARNLLIALIESTDILKVGTYPNRGSKAILGGLDVGLDPNQIESFISGTAGSGLNKHTLGWGMVFLHETLHTKPGGSLKDPKSVGTAGDVEKEMNIIRDELSKSYGSKFGTRFSYFSFENNGFGYIPFSFGAFNNLQNDHDYDLRKDIIRFDNKFRPK